MQLKDLLIYLPKHCLLDVTAVNKDKQLECFSVEAGKVKKKYTSYYVGYICPEESELSYCCRHNKLNRRVCLLLDIFYDESDAAAIKKI